MSRLAKFTVTLVGIVLVLLAVFELGQLYPIPWLTSWLIPRRYLKAVQSENHTVRYSSGPSFTPRLTYAGDLLA